MAQQMTYFAEDGSFGSADGMVILDTSKWSAVDWERVEQAGDDLRSTAAQAIQLALEWRTP